VKANPWYLFNSGPGGQAFNMASDEALLKAMPRLGKPVFRLYGWTEPGASFGYFQKYAEIERLTALRPLIRRPTGGGLVAHDADWTYSLAFPPGGDWYGLAAIETYRRIHEWIQAAFALLGFITDIAAQRHKPTAGQCFQGHEQFDLLWHGSKIAGAAQRRTRDGLLIQGSVQPASLRASPAEWRNAMCDVSESQYGVQWEEFTPDTVLMQEVDKLVRQKYSSDNYNRKR